MNKAVVSAAILSLAAAACSGEDTMTWEEFRAETVGTFEGKDYYVVSGDIGLTEEQARAFYARNVEGFATEEQASTVRRTLSGDDKWTAAQALQLTYCVSNEFGGNKARAVNEMAEAASAWEGVARVDFIYVPAHDGACNASNTAVKIPVRPWTNGGACAFFPSGGGCVTRTLVMNFTDFDTNPFWRNSAPNLRTVGVFRHELGHVLGLRHEHVRTESGAVSCMEDVWWRALTAYDRNSVMHYPHCNGNRLSTMSLTPSDVAGIRALYGAR